MPQGKRRPYSSEKRQAQAKRTKNRILSAAKRLFELKGFDKVTIEDIAQHASVSIPTIYALYKSKRGILRALMDEVFAQNLNNELNENVSVSPKQRLENTAKVLRQTYELEKKQWPLFKGAAVVDPEIKKLENEKEKARYVRQEQIVFMMAKENALAKNISLSKARDILWTLTSRDFYRMLVLERKWSHEDYEKWLAQTLIHTLLVR